MKLFLNLYIRPNSTLGAIINNIYLSARKHVPSEGRGGGSCKYIYIYINKGADAIELNMLTRKRVTMLELNLKNCPN